MVWTVDMDDFNNLCCKGSYPMLNTLHKELRGTGNTVHKFRNDCTKPEFPTTPAPPIRTTTYDSGKTAYKLCHFTILC